MLRHGLVGLLLLLVVGCGTPVANRPTPPLVMNITPAPTEDIIATQTAFVVQTVPTEQPRGIYIIREGDTLESIAIAFNTTIAEITATNNISDANTILIGQQLIIPSLISTTLPLTDTQDQSNDVIPTP